MMEDYYVRSRGRLTGPFTLDVLQQLVKRGKVNRFDQVSQDRSIWQPAAELPALFPPAAARPAVRTGVATGNATSESNGSPTRRSSGDGLESLSDDNLLFFYAQNGAAVGPISMSILRTLATNGTLKPDDQVWLDGSEIASPARQVPMLAALYSNRGKGSNTLAYQTYFDGDLPESVRSVQAYSTVIYFIVAGLTIVFHLIPSAIVEGRGFWWWDGPAQTIAAGIYAIAAAIAMFVITPLVKGIARPIIALSLIAVPIMFFSISFFANVAKEAGGSGVLGAGMLIGMTLFSILLAGANRIRPQLIDGGPVSIRVMQIVFGAIVGLSALGMIISLVSRGREVFTPFNGVFATSYICIWLGVLALLVAGTLAVVSGKPRFERSLAAISNQSMLAASILFIIALIVLLSGGGMLTGFTSYNFLIYTIMVVLVMTIVATFWLATSFGELLAFAYRRHAIN